MCECVCERMCACVHEFVWVCMYWASSECEHVWVLCCALHGRSYKLNVIFFCPSWPAVFHEHEHGTEERPTTKDILVNRGTTYFSCRQEPIAFAQPTKAAGERWRRRSEPHGERIETGQHCERGKRKKGERNATYNETKLKKLTRRSGISYTIYHCDACMWTYMQAHTHTHTVSHSRIT